MGRLGRKLVRRPDDRTEADPLVALDIEPDRPDIRDRLSLP